jgi:hypothetical protein
MVIASPQSMLASRQEQEAASQTPDLITVVIHMASVKVWPVIFVQIRN